ncbi:hypothetical protein [Streptomyces sp. NPDC085540]|uniref:hypothetical protein n=1 Tax=Streptomyces sp. NPDC085540 TaxID=3365730 RepID=UPI0037D56C26
MIATARLPQVLDDSSWNIALPSVQDELAVTPARLPWTMNAWEPRQRDAHPPDLDGAAHQRWFLRADSRSSGLSRSR